jgi:hypothetical protein
MISKTSMPQPTLRYRVARLLSRALLALHSSRSGRYVFRSRAAQDHAASCAIIRDPSYNRWAIILGLILGFTVITPVYADTSWYQVEVIVFEYTQPSTDGESWYVNPGLPNEENSIDLITTSVIPSPPAPPAVPAGGDQTANTLPQTDLVPYLALPKDHDQLDQVYRILTLSSAYKPLYHISWEQPGLPEDQALYVHFETRRNAEENQDANQESATTETESPQEGWMLDSAPPDLAFDAMLRLRAAQYLHLDVDVAYFPEDPSVLHTASAEGGLRPVYETADYVRLIETRRIRLKELHYFDNPLFGVIVQVTRIEDKDSEE